jgi:DNA-binding Lrp family transcriptional regulator
VAILRKNNATPQRAIGAAVNLSAPAAPRRVRRMEESGVIRANLALVGPAKVGRPLTIFVEMRLESERAELIDAAKRALAAAPEAPQRHYVAGEVDFFLTVVVATMSEYEALTRRLFFADANIKWFGAFVAMDCIKADFSVPLS